MNSEITPFYSNTNILVTGATGLFGKIIIQKLLRTCPDINGIYLIIRRKKGKSATERIEEMFNDAVFDKLREENAAFLMKIHIVDGDCSQVGLGLSNTDRKLLIDEINIVFHCAAEMNMSAKMKDALHTNVRGLSALLDLCHEMRCLKSMIFVSTAYSNCTQSVIEERFYETPIQGKTLMNLAEEITPNVLDNITPGLLDKWPNTYCYTKAIAESMLRSKAGNLPVGLFRPSIVMPTYSDPIPGWTGNPYGPVGVVLVAGVGILKVFSVDAQAKFDFVPVDLCVNALICSAWDVHEKRENSSNKFTEQQIPVYNCSVGSQRSVTWCQFLLSGIDGYEYPFKNTIWATMVIQTSNPYYFHFLWFLLHTIPGYLIDAYCIMTGKTFRLMKVYKRLWKFINVTSFFAKREWDIVNKNVECLWKQLNEKDKQLFPFDMDVIDFKKYMRDTCLGVKLYLLKESLDNAEAEKKRYQRLLMIHNTLKTLFRLLLLVCLYKFIGLFIAVVHKIAY